MQTLGRFAIIGGTVLVALANVILFDGADLEKTKIQLTQNYLYALTIPALSVLGVIMASITRITLILCPAVVSAPTSQCRLEHSFWQFGVCGVFCQPWHNVFLRKRHYALPDQLALFYF